MNKPRRLFINYKPNVNWCTMSFWVSIYIYFLHYFCLPNKLYIIIYIVSINYY